MEIKELTAEEVAKLALHGRDVPEHMTTKMQKEAAKIIDKADAFTTKKQAALMIVWSSGLHAAHSAVCAVTNGMKLHDDANLDVVRRVLFGWIMRNQDGK
jgi:hypothetical protein